MENPSCTYLHSISYELGEDCRIRDLVGLDCTENEVELLVERGLSNYSKIVGDIGQTILGNCSNTLRKGRVKGTDVDAVLIVTESFAELSATAPGWHDTGIRAVRNDLITSLASLGVSKAIYLCSTFGGSGNLLNALFMAAPMVRTGQVRNMLLICIDRNPSGVSRFMPDALAIAGDGVATCMVSGTLHPDTPNAYEIQHVGITPYSLLELDDTLQRAVLEMYRSSKASAADCYDATGKQPRDYEWLILNNYNRVTSQVFSLLLGFQESRAFNANLSRTGHIPACDSLINLSDLETSKGLGQAQNIFVFVNGPYSTGVISLGTSNGQSPFRLN